MRYLEEAGYQPNQRITLYPTHLWILKTFIRLSTGFWMS